jgi:hypothetical protein
MCHGVDEVGVESQRMEENNLRNGDNVKAYLKMCWLIMQTRALMVWVNFRMEEIITMGFQMFFN